MSCHHCHAFEPLRSTITPQAKLPISLDLNVSFLILCDTRTKVCEGPKICTTDVWDAKGYNDYEGNDGMEYEEDEKGKNFKRGGE
ncbi:peptidoglycan-recognition protein LC isoform X2 [Sesbania bispinosa]|nr:peptidoglycan-recognition protein LC isoform X2 [Sesbania bispinosa]